MVLTSRWRRKVQIDSLRALDLCTWSVPGAYEHLFEQVLDPFEHMLYGRTHVRSNV
jgi:hypothetical protein